MGKNVILFCGVESTGKSTTINIVYKMLKSKGYRVQIVSEAGREICDESGGVFEMTLLDYERILYLHQSNFLKTYANKDVDVILLDTDSTYTRYYLEKDNSLVYENPEWANELIALSESIAKNNLYDGKINKIIYMNPECPFVQDGTRTYESTRVEDDKTLIALYNEIYGKDNINIIVGSNWNERIKQVEKILSI